MEIRDYLYISSEGLILIVKYCEVSNITKLLFKFLIIGEASLLNDNQRMEVRNIVKEVVALIYEWEEDGDGESEEEAVLRSTINNNNDTHENSNVENNIPERLNSLAADVDNISKTTVDNETSVKDNNCICNSVSNRESGNDANGERVHDKVSLEPSSYDISDDYNKAISLTKRRLHLMEILGFKIITRLDVCSNIIEYSKEIGDLQTTCTYLKKGCDLAKILYGPCSVELSNWKSELSKINTSIVKN